MLLITVIQVAEKEEDRKAPISLISGREAEVPSIDAVLLSEIIIIALESCVVIEVLLVQEHLDVHMTDQLDCANIITRLVKYT